MGMNFSTTRCENAPMNFSEARRTQGWIVLIATVLGVGIGIFTFINSASTNHVYTVTCGKVNYKPSLLFKSCSNRSVSIGQIEWDSWSKAGAAGKGIYALNDCKPNCTTGKLYQVDVIVTLTGNSPLDIVKNKSVLNRLTIASRDKKPLPFSSSNTDSWGLQ